jgi:cysteine-rich repeat protein
MGRTRARALDLVCLLLAPALLGPAAGTTDFWTKAQQTLLLSETRWDAAPAPVPRPRDPILDMPRFLPLCGNGRIDTKADYAAYYADPRNLPLSLTRQQLFSGWTLAEAPDAARNLTLLADEACDDGNRLDRDGCSADCMQLDLWTSPCEIAVDRPALVYEDILYDPVRGAMLVSARDGVYALDTPLGATATRATLLAPKAFPVTNLFRQADSLLLYSAQHQSFWRLPDAGGPLTLLRNFSGLLSAWTDRGHCGADGSVVVHDSARIVYFADPLAAPVSCASPTLHRCLFVSASASGSLFRCDNFTQESAVEIGPGACAVQPRPAALAGSEGSLLADALALTLRQVGFRSTAAARMDHVLSPPEPLFAPFFSMTVYSPWGVLLEAPVSAARGLLTPGALPPMTSLGDPSLVRLFTNLEDNCGPGRCGFDTRLGYDLLAANPLAGASDFTWTHMLQDMIMQEAARAPAVTTLAALRADPARYARLLAAFASMFRWSTAPLAVLAFETHPGTRSLWAVRADRLVVIPKSGVQLQRADGRCLPVGVGLCPACQWAPVGLPCRPCSAGDPASWSWASQCKGRACTGRRLLAADSSIHFAVTGNLTAVRAAWPSVAVNGTLYSVEVVAADPIAAMRSVRAALELMAPGVQVLTQPHVRLLLPVAPPVAASTPPPAPPAENADHTLAIVLVAVLVPLSFIAVLCIAYLVVK